LDNENQSMFGKVLDNVEVGICFLAMFSMTVIIFLHVIFRYVLKSPLTWSEEVAKMCLVWITFGGSAYAFKVGAHVGVEFFIDKLPSNLRFAVQVLINAIIIVFFIFVGYYGVQICMGQVGKLSKAARIPLIIPWLAIPVGSALVILRMLYTEIVLLKNRKGSEA